MSMLSRTLSGLILVLALLSGAVILLSVVGSSSTQQVAQVEEQKDSFLQTVLSKLPLLPGRSKPVPVAVMIENHEGARPFHEGIAEAMMVQEFLVEGFISRFVAIFDSRSLPREIGPVRSLRPYFLDAIKPFTRTVFHAGGSPEALKRVKEGREFYALNLLYFDDEHSSLRHDEAPAPHNLFLTRALMKELLEDVPASLVQPVSWPPYPVGMPKNGEEATTVTVNFFSTLHNVVFEYLPLAEKYTRTNGGIVSPARPSTIIILEVPIDSIGEYGRLFMTTTGRGRAEVFHSGKHWSGHWSRNTDTQVIAITDENGEDIPMHRGQIWITVLPTLERVSFE